MAQSPFLDDAPLGAESQALLEETERQLGRTPNLYRALAVSPAALGGYLALRRSLLRGVLSATLREQLALLVAQENTCQYCVSAHTLRGAKLGLSPEEMRANRAGDAQDARSAAAIRFARRLLATRGRLEASDLSAVTSAAWSPEELAEIVAHVALNTFSNLWNHVAQPALDFPAVDLALDA
jgi:AhpD family alkylhydroperoxidase